MNWLTCSGISRLASAVIVTALSAESVLDEELQVPAIQVPHGWQHVFAGGIFDLAEPGKMPDCPNIAAMTTKTKSAGARIETRVSSDLKKQLKKAAAVTGHTTLNSYVVFALTTSAAAAIEEHKRAKLDAEQSESFVDALLNPPKPGSTLKSAFKQYRAQVGAGR
jgi:uncharacterized protein (DUF1778 family)